MIGDPHAGRRPAGQLSEQAQAEGVFDKTATDAVTEVVMLFEVFGHEHVAARAKHADGVAWQDHGLG